MQIVKINNQLKDSGALENAFLTLPEFNHMALARVARLNTSKDT